MCEKADGGMRKVWGPEGDGTVLVSEVDDGVLGVLAHGMTCTKLCTMLYDKLSCGGILIFKVACISLYNVNRCTTRGQDICTHDRDKEPVVG